MIRLELDRLLVRFERFLWTAKLVKDVPEIVVRINVVGGDLQRTLNEVDRQERAPLLVTHYTEVMQGVGVVLIVFQHCHISRLGFFESPALVRPDCRGYRFPDSRRSWFQASPKYPASGERSPDT